MRQLAEFNGYRAYLLDEASDVDYELAKDICDVNLEAYWHRFQTTGISKECLAYAFGLKSDDDWHVWRMQNDVRLDLHENVNWVIATERDDKRQLGVRAVGFASVKANEEGLRLLELHTHPSHQHKGLARRLAGFSLALAYSAGTFDYSPDTRVSLSVVREEPVNNDDFPGGWYYELGFRQCEYFDTHYIGLVPLRFYNMRGRVGEILGNLSTNPNTARQTTD
jgi:ribosomal protein S18 acetylase RimI-like enzyme